MAKAVRVEGLQTFKAKTRTFFGKGGLTDKKVAEVQRRVSLEVLTSVILRSPVDTGRFRGSWTAQVGSASDATLPAGADSYPSPSPAGLLASSGLSGPYVALYVSNALPYAQRLEEGWSKQAPSGIVAQTIASLR